ncbi:DUF5318 family protein [Stomatohabitans albus]|uniref:DUF5318 family protein n=1 Tax=Stomatohabitans albus TaxID=3110766 RepID=UPI00300BFE49
MSSTIDYRLAKRAVVRRLVNGELSTDEVCDAHPELLRASTFLGVPTRRACPVCQMNHGDDLETTRSVPQLVETTWLYGTELRQKNGHLVENPADLSHFERRFPSFRAWTVECCITCGWNYLIAQRLCGFSHRPGHDLAERTRQMRVSSHE